MHHTYNIDAVKAATASHWPFILQALGIDGKHLTGKPGPCPICGGKDRFQFTAKGHGADWGRWSCRGCGGGGDGWRLAMLRLDSPFVAVIAQVAGILNLPPETSTSTPKVFRPRLNSQVLLGAKTDLLLITMEAYRADDTVEEDAIDAAHGMLSGILGGERQETREATLRALATLLANAVNQRAKLSRFPG